MAAVIFGVFWQVLMPIVLAAGLGYLLARRIHLPSQHLSRVAFYILSPCLLFDKLSHSSLSGSQLGQIATFAVATMLGTALLAWMAARALRSSRSQTAAFVLAALAGNTGNYGLAANQFAFGPAALEPAVVYYAVSTLMIATLGVYVVSAGQQGAAAALRSLWRVPLTYAGVLGVAVWATGVPVPVPVERTASLLGQGAIPVMLVLLGVQLAGVRLQNSLTRISLAAAVKLLGGMAVGLLVAHWMGLSGLTRQSSVLQASMPTAVMATVLADEYHAEAAFTAGVVMASTLGSLVTLTLLLSFLI
ncbi:MAG: AEC family transporter [Caldilineales bacterium]|nr:AEC family transporter [Caldilineales bacterium]MDW8317236.1 AEC family transporter [Anaerolineae bacterium]